MGQWGIVMPQLPLAFFEKKNKKNNKNNVCHYLSQYRASYSIFFFSLLISATHVFSLQLFPTQLLSLLSFLLFSFHSLDFCSSQVSVSHTLASQTQKLELSHQLPSFLFQTLIPPNKNYFFPLHLKISGSHLIIFLFFFALSQIAT